jgi:hypothetical protein
LQPTLETREKQLRLWKELILDYCSKSNVYQINPATFPFFKNESINRQMSVDGIRAIVEFLLANRNAEWDDTTRTILRIMWKTPESLGMDIYEWASKKEVLGTVYTIYELVSGDEYTESGEKERIELILNIISHEPLFLSFSFSFSVFSGFHGTDLVLFRRALQYLESQRKVSFCSCFSFYFLPFLFSFSFLTFLSQCKIISGGSPDEDGVKFLSE